MFIDGQLVVLVNRTGSLLCGGDLSVGGTKISLGSPDRVAMVEDPISSRLDISPGMSFPGGVSIGGISQLCVFPEGGESAFEMYVGGHVWHKCAEKSSLLAARCCGRCTGNVTLDSMGRVQVGSVPGSDMSRFSVEGGIRASYGLPLSSSLDADFGHMIGDVPGIGLFAGLHLSPCFGVVCNFLKPC